MIERGGRFAPDIAQLRGKLPQGPPTSPGRKSSGCGNRGEWHWSDPQPIPKPARQGVWFNDYVAVAGPKPRLRYSLCARVFG